MMYPIYIDTRPCGLFSIREVLLVATSKKSSMHNLKGHPAPAEKKRVAKPHVAAEDGDKITVDRRESRERRLAADRRSQNVSVAVDRRMVERRVKVSRRRQIDPTTCERDYTTDEIEFMSAIEQYKRLNGRMFPTCSEVLEVLKSLGYEKRPQVEPAAVPMAGLPIAPVVSSLSPMAV